MNQMRRDSFAEVNKSIDAPDKDKQKDGKVKKQPPYQGKLTDAERLKTLQQYASEHKLKYIELKHFSGRELNDLAQEAQEVTGEEIEAGKLDSDKHLIGLAREDRQDRRFLLDVLYGPQPLLLYTSIKAIDTKNGKRYVCWALDNVPQHTPEFKEAGVEEEVLKAWRLVQAAPLATERAEEISKLIQENKLFTPLVDLAVAELRVELLARGMKKEVQGQDMLDWLDDKLKAHQNAISDIGDDPPETEDKPKKEDPKKKTEKDKKEPAPPKVAPKKKEEGKKDKKKTEDAKKKTSLNSNASSLKFVTFLQDKKEETKKKEEKGKKEPAKETKPTPKNSGSKKPTEKTKKKPTKKKTEPDEKLLELQLLYDSIVYRIDLDNPHFVLNDTTKVEEILDWLTSRIDTPKGDASKKQQLEKVRTGLTLQGKPKSDLLQFNYAGSFSWLQLVPRQSRQGGMQLFLSSPVSIEKPDNDFMKYVFEDLNNEETGTVANSDRTVTYVVTIHDRTPSNEQQRMQMSDQFMSDGKIFQTPASRFTGMMVQEQRNLNSAWIASLVKEYNLTFPQNDKK